MINMLHKHDEIVVVFFLASKIMITIWSRIHIIKCSQIDGQQFYQYVLVINIISWKKYFANIIVDFIRIPLFVCFGEQLFSRPFPISGIQSVEILVHIKIHWQYTYFPLLTLFCLELIIHAQFRKPTTIRQKWRGSVFIRIFHHIALKVLKNSFTFFSHFFIFQNMASTNETLENIILLSNWTINLIQ